jgi:apolipoprotein N-acyltransferase
MGKAGFGTGGEKGPGWRHMLSRGGLAVLSGVMLALSFPKFHLAPLAFVALAPLLVAGEGLPAIQGAYLGILAGAVCSLMSLPWLVHTMGTYGGLPFLLSVLVLVVLSLYLSLYVGAFVVGVTRLSSGKGLRYVAGAGALWVALEYARTFLLTGFPWNLLGYTQYRNLPLIQIASFTGVYGISFLLALANAVLALAYLRFRRGEGRIFLPVIGVGVIIVGVVQFGKTHLASGEAGGGEVRVLIAQGNIEQGIKWDRQFVGRTLTTYRRLSRRAGEALDLIVWPETAVPFFLQEGGPWTEEVLDVPRALGAHLLVGSPDRTDGDPPRYYNSAFLVAPAGKIVQKYDKMHLVPFGEYVPLSSVLFFVQRMAHGIGDFSPGRSFTVFETPKGRFAVLICFEAIFPDQVRRYVLAGADFLVNITNDAWFGDSAAPYQHLSMAAMRAVENGVFLVRAANTGISALVAPSGRIVQQSGLFVETILSGAVARGTGGTWYTRYGDLFAWGCVGISGFLLAARRRHSPRKGASS